MTKSYNQQEKELRLEPNPNKSQGFNAGKVAYRNSGLRFMRLNMPPVDTLNQRTKYSLHGMQHNNVFLFYKGRDKFTSFLFWAMRSEGISL
jgi:hypothetical protein